MGKFRFLKIDAGILTRYGQSEAILVGFLFNLSKTAKKDSQGFFACEISYIAKNINASRPTVLKTIQSAVYHRLIRYEPGKNQNAKPRFKIF